MKFWYRTIKKNYANEKKKQIFIKLLLSSIKNKNNF